MNSFRFRAWDLTQKCYLPYYDLEHWKNTTLNGIFQSGRFVFEMWTGAYDINGEEIYKGDIVEVNTVDGYNRFEVKFGVCNRIMDTGAAVEIRGFYFSMIAPGEAYHGKPYFSITNNWRGGHDLEVTKVIGTVLENPELLK